jgi:hypothetical protein
MGTAATASQLTNGSMQLEACSPVTPRSSDAARADARLARGHAGGEALLAERGSDPVFGARPLKRAIQRMIENPLAVEFLAGSPTGAPPAVFSLTSAGELQ